MLFPSISFVIVSKYFLLKRKKVKAEFYMKKTRQYVAIGSNKHMCVFSFIWSHWPKKVVSRWKYGITESCNPVFFDDILAMLTDNNSFQSIQSNETRKIQKQKRARKLEIKLCKWKKIHKCDFQVIYDLHTYKLAHFMCKPSTSNKTQMSWICAEYFWSTLHSSAVVVVNAVLS